MKLRKRRLFVQPYPLANPKYLWYYGLATDSNFLSKVEAGTASLLGSTTVPEILFDNIPSGTYQFALVVEDTNGFRSQVTQAPAWRNAVMDFEVPQPITNFEIV